MPTPTAPANAGGSTTSTTPKAGDRGPKVVLQHEGEAPEGYDAAADEGGIDLDAMAKEIVGGKKATIKANARSSGADAEEALDLEGGDGEGDEPELEATDEDEGEGEGEGAEEEDETETQGDEITREDGAVWNAEANRWIKDNRFVAGDPPEAAAAGEGGEGAEGGETQLPEGIALFEGDEEVELPEGVKVKFKSLDGKREYEKDLLGLVELAQRGVYNHDLQQEVTRARGQTEYVGQLEGAITQYEQRDKQYDQYLERLFADDDFFATEAQAYQEQNTPEARVERLRQELEEERTARAADKESLVAETTLQTKVWPEVARIQATHKGVTGAEIVSEFGRLTAHLKVNGRVPPAKFAEVASIVRAQLAPWAAQLHEARTRQTTVAKRKSDKAAAEAAKRQTREQQEKIRLRKVAARAIAPTGGASGGGTARGNGARRPPKTAQEGADRALETALAAAGV